MAFLTPTRRRWLPVAIFVLAAALAGEIALWLWSTSTTTPGRERLEPAITAAGNEIFYIGGIQEQKHAIAKLYTTLSGQPYRMDIQPSTTVDALNLATGQWRRCAPLPYPHAGGSAVADGNYVYLFGGAADNGCTLPFPYRVIMRYEITADRWEILPDLMPVDFNEINAAKAGNIFVVSGLTNYSLPMADTFAAFAWAGTSDTIPAEQRWIALNLDAKDTFVPEYARLAVGDNTLWLTGVTEGSDSMCVVPYALPALPVPFRSTGIALPPGPARFLPQGRIWHATVWHNGKLLIMGGASPTGNNVRPTSDTVAAIDPDTAGWQSARPLPAPMCFLYRNFSPVSSNNRILIPDWQPSEYIP